MADINAQISFGIGSPASIEHFILDGLNANASSVIAGANDQTGTFYPMFIPTVGTRNTGFFMRASCGEVWNTFKGSGLNLKPKDTSTHGRQWSVRRRFENWILRLLRQWRKPTPQGTAVPS